MSTFRLDSVSPRLAASFRQAPPAKRRRAARLACEIAVSSIGLSDREIVLALEMLRSEAPIPAPLRLKIESLAAHLDEEYFRLDKEAEENDGDKAEAISYFSKARAASAVMFALSNDDGQLHEAIYEAIAALDDPSGLVSSVEEALR